MEKDKLIERLMATFLGELEDRVGALNRDLLALEKEPAAPARAELLGSLFRTAHSLKGASRSVGINPLESGCHGLEEILSGVLDGRLPLDAERFQLLFATADAIKDAGERLRRKQELAGGALEKLLPRIGVATREPGQGMELHPATTVGQTPVRLPMGDGFVRVEAERLDALMSRSGELLIARRRSEVRQTELYSLRESVNRWQREWRPVDRAIKKLARTNEAPPNGQPANGRKSADALPRRAILAIEQVRDNIRKVDKDLERLASRLAADRGTLEQAARPLEDDVRRVRMLPISEACEGLDRTVRDLTKAGDKDVELIIEGGDVQLDRSVLEKLRDPLMHLVRNAVDHGIEPPEMRQSIGKPTRGRVTVGASLRGTQVEIVVEDDGRGLDLAAIREQARKRRLPEPEEDREAARLIFLPGFSTSPIITEVSGRGVGLDVVKGGIEFVHGTLDFSFSPGKGTRFILTVPSTLTTARAVLVNASGETFAFLTMSVRTLLRIGPEDIRSVEGREVVCLGETPVPLGSLGETLGLNTHEASGRRGKVPVVVLASGGREAAFAVDELLAEQELVVKNLGPRLLHVKNLTGATILPTGRIALILNAQDLIEAALGHVPRRTLATALAQPEPEAKKRVLVVDDSVTTRSLEKSILEAAGYDVEVAVDGMEGWQILQERGTDLVVADIEMPRMDGFSLTEAIRGSKRFRDLPVVLVTALESEKDKARGMDAGADAYLLKSAFDQRNLLETVAQLL